jgi:hypothetical protein
MLIRLKVPKSQAIDPFAMSDEGLLERYNRCLMDANRWPSRVVDYKRVRSAVIARFRRKKPPFTTGNTVVLKESTQIVDLGRNGYVINPGIKMIVESILLWENGKWVVSFERFRGDEIIPDPCYFPASKFKLTSKITTRELILQGFKYFCRNCGAVYREKSQIPSWYGGSVDSCLECNGRGPYKEVFGNLEHYLKRKRRS